MKNIYVSKKGNNHATGSENDPVLSISEAASLAEAGDTVFVGKGIYREEINPPRGGSDDQNRITYQPVNGEEVVICGSEIIENWENENSSIWYAKVPNTLFKDFNPYSDKISGDWFTDKGRDHHTGCVYLNNNALYEAADFDSLKVKKNHWFASVDKEETTIFANFGEQDPNEHLIEINVRQSVFYPRKTNINYITVKGFILRHAATPWAPPTAEQIGLIGTHWSKGWIIEDNHISHSRCSGITLGKYGDEFDNKSADLAIGYVETINRANENGWSRDNIGSHIVRNNTISNCEQTGICGSLGAIFSKITDNHIHHIHTELAFAGAEQAGIKLHAPIDTLIARNNVHHCNRGIWMDWMTQGTRITSNLCYENQTEEDLFLEVNHGPCIVDNNIFLSNFALTQWSEGCAFIHNLFGGLIRGYAERSRETPFHYEHSIEIEGIINIIGGDDRFINNVVIDQENFEKFTASTREARVEDSLDNENLDTYPINENTVTGNAFISIKPELTENGSSRSLTLYFDAENVNCQQIQTDNLKPTLVSNKKYKDYTGKDIIFDTDFNGYKRSNEQINAGPFIENTEQIEIRYPNET